MSIICQCASCKAKYEVGDQHAGKTIKCPKCSAAVAVPAGPGASKIVPEVALPPAGAIAGSQDAGSPVPAEDGLGFLSEEPALRGRAGRPRSPSDSGKHSRSSSIASHHHKRKKQDLPAWLVPTIAGIGVAAVAAIAVTIYVSARKLEAKSDGGAQATENKTGKPSKSEEMLPLLSIDWPVEQRRRRAFRRWRKARGPPYGTHRGSPCPEKGTIPISS